MHGHRIGYVRVSSFDQNPERQLEHVPVDRLFSDKASGKDRQRPELERLLAFARQGDTVVVHSMDRLARNLDDLRLIVQKLTKGGVRIEFVKENLTFTGEDSPLANLMLSVMGAFAEFERALIGERQREGIALARQRGAYRGRKKSLSPEQAAQLRQRVQAGARKAPWPASLASVEKPSINTSAHNTDDASLDPVHFWLPVADVEVWIRCNVVEFEATVPCRLSFYELIA